jgi:DNA-directed RNA polymerase subunit RPC12/RpoP
MDQRIFHGDLEPRDFARSLVGEFHRGNLRVQQIGDHEQIVVQIASREHARSGGQTALSVTLQKVADGVAVKVGKQSWLGVAASLGESALRVWRNPFGLLDRLDDLAQDIEYLQLNEQVWELIEKTAQTLGATSELSKRLRRTECPYCQTANPVGEPRCIACGAPLGRAQPETCPDCGFVVKGMEENCPNCGRKL